MLLQPKQISKIITAPVKIAAFTFSSGESAEDVTAELTTALNLAGNNGTSVPLQTSGDVFTQGVVVSSPNNRCEVYDNVTKEKLTTATGEEVYGKLTFAASVYTLTLYYLDGGAETLHTTTGDVDIDFDFSYRFTFEKLPADALISSYVRNVSQDPHGSQAALIVEKLTVTGTNTLSALANIPATPTNTKLVINGHAEYAKGASPSFAVSGTTVTWNAGNSGYALETTDTVFVEYYI